MFFNKDRITVVCIANYCRSPVAEYALKKRYENKFDIFSAGISPLPESNMDTRSSKFLEKNNIDFGIHNPKKLTESFIKKSRIVFAMDLKVLLYLNKKYKKHAKKFKLFSYQHPRISLADPYKLNNKDYEDIMNNIIYISENIKI